jgi:TonB family protein
MRVTTFVTLLLSLAAPCLRAQRPPSAPIPEQAVDEAPRLIPGTCMRPPYPAELRNSGISGRVVVRAVVDTVGRPESESLVILRSSLRAFELPAKVRVLSCRYHPGRIRGTPVRTEVSVTVNFRPPSRVSADSQP